MGAPTVFFRVTSLFEVTAFLVFSWTYTFFNCLLRISVYLTSGDPFARSNTSNYPTLSQSKSDPIRLHKPSKQSDSRALRYRGRRCKLRTGAPQSYFCSGRISPRRMRHYCATPETSSVNCRRSWVEKDHWPAIKIPRFLL